eukprot:Ihof_evm2s31 gene=Ihof_evmTU2s31
MTRKEVTCTAPVNIAVIKYWGKREEDLILPINSSLSATLDQSQLKTTTTVVADSSFTEDRIYLNGKEEKISNPRLQNVLCEMRGRASDVTGSEQAALVQCKVHIISKNNFPTAAGLASSASGYACLVYTLATLFNVDTNTVSSVARVGSGSACRSMYGGWVRWDKGVSTDGKDSIAVQTHTTEHWPEMQILILVVSDHKKTTSSTSGMGTSVQTSDLIMHRANVVVPQRLAAIEKAITDKDFETFGRITMQDSNQFHAVCMDTYPPIFYMNDVSRAIVNLITQYNAAQGAVKAAYTFDAGPNAVIYALKENMSDIVSLVSHYFPTANSD